MNTADRLKSTEAYNFGLYGNNTASNITVENDELAQISSIGAIIVGVLLMFCIAVIFVAYCWRERKMRKDELKKRTLPNIEEEAVTAL